MIKELKAKDYTICLEEVFAPGPLVPTFHAKDSNGSPFLARCAEKSVFSSQILSALKTEAEFLSKFDCPHLIKLVQSIDTETHLVFVYENCNIGTLSHIKRPMTEKGSQDFLLQLLKIICTLSIDGIAVTFLSPDTIYANEVNGKVFYKLGTLIQTTSINALKADFLSYIAPETKDSTASVYCLGKLLKYLTQSYDKPTANFSHLISRCIDPSPSSRIPMEDLMFHPFMVQPHKLQDEYSLVKLLGEGEFAETYLAAHKPTGKEYAIKVLKIKQATLSLKFFDENTMLKYLLLLERETALMYSIAYSTGKKDGLVILKDHFVDDNVLYLVTEYCPGGPLSAVIKQYPKGLPKETLYHYAKTLAECMQQLHTMDIVHRFLTPQHILLTDLEPSKAHLKLASFTMSIKLLTRRKGHMEQIISAQSYIPPEATTIERDFEFSYSYDMWSYGVIIYELAFGKQPIHLSNDEKDQQVLKINMMQKGEVKFPERADLDKGFIELIKRCLRVNKALRPTAKEILVSPLFSGEQ